jgi:hypothetical protein
MAHTHSELVIATSAHVDIGGAFACPHVVAPFVWSDPIFGDSPFRDDVRGKIVGICRDPELKGASFFSKAMDAQSRGALGVVFVAERSSEIRIVADHGTDVTTLTVPCALISTLHARKLRDDTVVAFHYRRFSTYYTFVYLNAYAEPYVEPTTHSANSVPSIRAAALVLSVVFLPRHCSIEWSCSDVHMEYGVLLEADTAALAVALRNCHTDPAAVEIASVRPNDALTTRLFARHRLLKVVRYSSRLLHAM